MPRYMANTTQQAKAGSYVYPESFSFPGFKATSADSQDFIHERKHRGGPAGESTKRRSIVADGKKRTG